MKKTTKRLRLDRITVVNLQAVVGARGPDDVSVWYACPTDVNCGESHAYTCGRGTACKTYTDYP